MEDTENNNAIIQDLKNKLVLLAQERDSAVEMWKLAEIVASNAKDEMKALSSCSAVDTLKKDMETMQQDYSDAIKLLENKVKFLANELKLARNKNTSIEEDICHFKSKMLQIEREKHGLQEKFQQNQLEKEHVEKSLRETRKKLDESGGVEREAREKVEEALWILEEALSNEASILKEKEKLEVKLNAMFEETETRLEKEINNVKTVLNTRIDTVTNQLHSVTAEKHRLSIEYESLKAEYSLKLQEVSLKYKTISQELDEIRCRRQSELSQWSDERDLLRKQITTLQAELESVLIELRQKEKGCPNCLELKVNVEKYRALSKEWEEAAFSVTKEFEKYMEEVSKLKANVK